MVAISSEKNLSLGMTYAFRCLSQRDYSVGQLHEKLLGRGYAEDCVNQIIKSMEDLSYINDERYAEMIVKNYRHKYGKRHLQSILKSKYISTDISQIVLENISEEDEYFTACSIIEKELRKSQNNISSREDQYRISQKLVQRLTSKGIDLNIAYEAVKNTIAKNTLID